MKPKIISLIITLAILFYAVELQASEKPIPQERAPAIEQTTTQPGSAGETGTAGDDTLANYYRAGMSISGTVVNLDSGVTRYTPWFDATLFDGVSLYLTKTFKSDSTTADTMRVIIEGRDGKVQALTMKMDTILVVGSAGTTITQTAITISSYLPEWRIELQPYSTNEGNDGWFKWSIYAPTNDTVPPKLNLGNF